MERNIKLVLEYDGTGFHGSQLQVGQRTVQAELETAIERLTQRRTRVVMAGRTDTGVHAVGQVANFVTESGHSLEVFVRGMNALLPDDVAVKEAEVAPPGFHARFSAVAREYEYTILQSRVPSPLLRYRVWRVSRPLDVEAMERAAASLVGERDFASFAGAGHGVPGAEGGTVRIVTYAGWRLGDGERLLRFTIRANAFLPHMVRNIVGTLVMVGTGEATYAEWVGMLEARDRRVAGPTAPAMGLCLTKVSY